MPGARTSLHEEAIAEARAVRRWYEERSPAAAAAFMEELDRAIAQIGEFPEAWPPYIAGTRRYILRRFPYSVVYRRRDAAVQIVAIAHHRRRPGYWKSRVKN